jgi:hypothetical protein
MANDKRSHSAAKDRDKKPESSRSGQSGRNRSSYLSRAQEFLGDPLHGVRLGIGSKDRNQPNKR